MPNRYVVGFANLVWSTSMLKIKLHVLIVPEDSFPHQTEKNARKLKCSKYKFYNFDLFIFLPK